ncbi:hypothetical protein KMT30_17605 [Streptomyces sp. IBSBF 2953]|uniref:hypothetical protein n=1 Tax=Streptomyces TaxID=1883 RepID=UPI002119FEB8|nr:hypothetical protein [Streptomyces scabiei]MCQ9180820.1 hypothetical protein [Streptomyces hayashii]MDX3115013.1 hypothetical protein [Streptomyces scabiei]
MSLARIRTRGVLSAAALLALATTALGASDAGASTARAAAPGTRQIASSVLGADYKVTLTALRSTGDAYAASVRMQVYTRSGGAWKESDRVTVGDVDGWFWYPLTGSGAVCRFSTAGTEPAPIEVSLLLTPSLGCSEPAHYVVRHGKVHAG